jgi:hypothetical protein
VLSDGPLGVPAVALQLAALWLLVLALGLVGTDPDLRQASDRPARPVAGTDAAFCPFCGAPGEPRRSCWCGADGWWL